MGKLVFGGLIAIVLLGLYAYATLIAILAALCLGAGPCTSYTPTLNEGIITVLNLVGGLVSALVVAELAITQAGEAPAARLLATDVTETAKTATKVISSAYILVWVICGVAALVVGYLKYPNVVPALTASAKTWLGLAVAAAYSYLGIKQS